MRNPKPWLLLALIGACLAGAWRGNPAALAQSAPAIRYDQAFWQRWSDGKAEVAGYELRFARYGQERAGTAVAIVVKEDFSEADRVKADGIGAGTFPVLKLNLLKDFPTGVYDYHLMLSTFVGLKAANGLPAGATNKVSFSAQEWCGHVYQQLLFGPRAVEDTLHSYFQSEGNRARKVKGEPGGLSEDALFLWARGLAAPALEPGQRRQVKLFSSLQEARLAHRAAGWVDATLSRAAQPASVEVGAGTFEADVFEAKLPGRSWTFWVERSGARRLLRWKNGRETGSLLKSVRMPYWSLSGRGNERLLEQLGLKPRPPRTP
ncbi:MAG TPA: hypothetical protein DEA08_03230 [Planctomycetes bacterium]|nr:hypothetical protein [Planctomycetota bacterium]